MGEFVSLVCEMSSVSLGVEEFAIEELEAIAATRVRVSEFIMFLF